ncbi:MAG: prepilin-type N-terminal cleavage/methylation domain-containing protein [candidate division Zixibacteria bacterium]|nr:prepilin-type N-terminal cleavage/methylation domain-containing protein [candidate division Zixibacteria bacterium]
MNNTKKIINIRSDYPNSNGFTLIELVVTIVILAILGTGAITHYQDITGASRESSLKGSLGGLRESISIWHMHRIVTTGYNNYPSIAALMLPNEVCQAGIPSNPYQDPSNAPDSIVEGTTMGDIVGERGGYAYNPTTGEIWANTNTDIQPTCKNPAGKLGENNW